MEKKHLMGIKACGIEALLISLLLLFAYFSLLALPSMNLRFLIIPISIAIGFGVSGIFIFKLKNWARILFMFQMMYWAILGLKGVRAFYILDLSEMVKADNYPESWLGWLIFFIFPASASIYFLTRPKVKEEFK